MAQYLHKLVQLHHFSVMLYFNVANSNKSNNLVISCQWQVLTESYLMRSTKLL